MKNSVTRRDKLRIIIAVFFICAMLISEMIPSETFAEIDGGEWISAMISRFSGGILCLLLITSFLSSKFFIFDISLKKLLIFIPCMLIAINNFPFVTVISGDAYIGKNFIRILL